MTQTHPDDTNRQPQGGTVQYPPITKDTFTQERLMRSWSQDGFLLELYETGVTLTPHSHTAVAYRLYDVDFSRETGDGSPIFENTDFGVPRHDTIDGDESVRGLLTFLSLCPGDTDADYFEHHTERQFAWLDARAETLSLWSSDDVDLEDVPSFDDPDSYTR